MHYLQEMHCAENLMFWLEVERYKKIGDLEARNQKARDIVEMYLHPGATYEVNIAYELRKEVYEQLPHPTEETFSESQKAIFLLLVHGTVDYFLAAERGNRQKKGSTVTSHQQKKKKQKKCSTLMTTIQATLCLFQSCRMPGQINGDLHVCRSIIPRNSEASLYVHRRLRCVLNRVRIWQ